MSNNWLNRIRQHAATPPEGAWQHIAGCLDNDERDNEDFVTKLSALEIAPPAAAQKNIFALLDAEENVIPFEQRIYNYEVKAPEAVWPGIITELNSGETKIIPFTTRTKKTGTVYLRAAAAAVVITLLSITAWLLNRQSSGMRETAAVTPQKQQVTVPVTGNEKTALPASDTQEEKKTAIVTANVKSTVVTGAQTQLVPTGPAYIQSNEALTLAQNPAHGKKDKLQTVTGETPEDVTLLNAPGSYITIAGPDGQSVRVSSKLSNLISYLTEKDPEAQENLDIIIKESAQWRATFAKWREKMTNNAVAPSLANFMDIIELSNVLEEKK